MSKPQPPAPLYPVLKACDEALGVDDDPRAIVERPLRFWRGTELF